VSEREQAIPETEAAEWGIRFHVGTRLAAAEAGAAPPLQKEVAGSRSEELRADG